MSKNFVYDVGLTPQILINNYFRNIFLIFFYFSSFGYLHGMKIYKLNNPHGTPAEIYYTSITAILQDTDNPINISNRRWSQIVKETGYPILHSGCEIDLFYARTLGDIKKKLIKNVK